MSFGWSLLHAPFSCSIPLSCSPTADELLKTTCIQRIIRAIVSATARGLRYFADIEAAFAVAHINPVPRIHGHSGNLGEGSSIGQLFPPADDVELKIVGSFRHSRHSFTLAAKTSSTKWHLLVCPLSAIERNDGESDRHRSFANGQRGLKAHPDGIRARSGGCPSIGTSL